MKKRFRTTHPETRREIALSCRRALREIESSKRREERVLQLRGRRYQ